jgi:1-acyl-sn-glycerol-3-phosphate acyltransferase
MRRRSAIKAALGNLWLCAFGWTAEDAAPEVEKAVLIAAPHTSNWDLPFMLALAYVLGLDVHWLGKHTLFRPPFGGFMRWLGGHFRGPIGAQPLGGRRRGGTAHP